MGIPAEQASNKIAPVIITCKRESETDNNINKGSFSHFCIISLSFYARNDLEISAQQKISSTVSDISQCEVHDCGREREPLLNVIGIRS